MYLVVVGWLYVIGMVALITAFDANGGWLRAIVLWVFAGMLPMGLLLYLAGWGRRQRQRMPQAGAGAASPEKTPEHATSPHE